MSAWKSHTTPEGRTYYYKPGSNITQWEKPDDFDAPQTPATPAPAGDVDSAWREAKTEEGRTYYWNTVTKETAWNPPSGFGAQKQSAREPPAFVAGGAQNFSNDDRGFSDRRMGGRGDRDAGLPQKPSFDGGRGGSNPWEQRQEQSGFRGPMPVKADEPEYATQEQAEEAFFKLLRKHNIAPDTHWEDAVRQVVKEREYRALKDARERRVAFDKYCVEARAQEATKEKERRAKVREDFSRMLSTHDEIKHYTRWKTARPMIEREVVFKSAGDEDERRQLYDDYILELKRRHVEDEIAQHRQGLKELQQLLQALITDPDMKWQEARKAIENNERFKSDGTFTSLNQLDVVTAFENHMTALGRITNEAKQIERRLQSRHERQARDGFRQLMQELRGQGKIKAGTKWSDIQPIIAEDQRYTNILGNAGSSPLDLLWDVVEEEERGLRGLRNDALDVLEDRQYEMTVDTTLSEFGDVMRTDRRTANMSSDQLALVYDRLLAKVKKRNDENRVVNERSQRRAAEDLRSVMKRLEPPIRLSDSYEDVAPRLQDYEEFRVLDDPGRRAAFEKHIRRQKDKEDEMDRDRARRDRDRDRDRDRERDRSRRGHDRDRDRRHRTRTPEIDVYEAERRKAQADREHRYRRPSFGLTPPPRDRRDDRDDRYRRHDRQESMSHYDRERREREMERERNYVSRADPRDRGKTLDYGDEETVSSRPGSVRKRRDSEGSVGGKRDVKVSPVLDVSNEQNDPNFNSVPAATAALPTSRCKRMQTRHRRCKAAARKEKLKRSSRLVFRISRLRACSVLRRRVIRGVRILLLLLVWLGRQRGS